MNNKTDKREAESNMCKQKSPFTIIPGDRSVSPLAAGGDFLKAEVTNTRLMGALGIHVIRLPLGEGFTEGTVPSEKPFPMQSYFHQLFYLDMEEYGFDDYRSYLVKPDDGETKADLEADLSELFGGLGGEWVEINEDEVIYLLKAAVKINRLYDEELPEGWEEYAPLLDSPSKLNPSEEYALWRKMCCKIATGEELVNYYIMRLTAKDYEACKILRWQGGNYHDLSLASPGTLYKNDIEEPTENAEGIKTSVSYISTSLIEDTAGYRIIRSETTVMGPLVTDFRIVSDMQIGEWEATNIMRKQEFDSLYKLKSSKDALMLLDYLNLAFPNSTKNSYRDGLLLMLFRENNHHVRNRNYRLDQDTIASIFVSESGDLIISGHQADEIEKLEKTIGGILQFAEIPFDAVGKYAFQDAALGHFLGYGTEIFSDFLEFIQFFAQEVR